MGEFTIEQILIVLTLTTLAGLATGIGGRDDRSRARGLHVARRRNN